MSNDCILLPRHLGGNRRGATLVVVLFVLILPAIAIGGWLYYRNANDNTATINAPITEAAFRAPFDHIVLEQGEVESSSNSEVKCEVEGRGSTGTPVLWVIDEGAYVKTGDKLAELDSSSLEVELQVQRIEVTSAEALVISSDAALKQAEIGREEYLQGLYQTERKAILSEIAVAEQEKRRTELSLASAERLAAKGTLRPLQIQAEQFAVVNAQNVLDSANSRLRVLEELTKKKMLVQLDSAIETARAQLDANRSNLVEEKGELRDLEAQIAACTVLAPTEGQVVHANQKDNRGGNEFILEPGAMVREQQTLFLLPDPTKMQIRAKVNESQITLISEGMPVQIRVGPHNLLGRVSKVNKYAEAGSWFSSSVKEYVTFIQIIDPPPGIRTGMTAEVRIFVEQLSDALQVPVHAIYETQGHYLALKEKGGGKYETAEVEVDASNKEFVAVKSGLAEGDRVVLNPRRHLNLMDIPEFEVVSDRAQLLEIGQSRPTEAAPAGIEAGGSSAASPEGRDPAGGAAPGGGRPNPAEMLKRAMESDADKDGKISKDEAAGNERMAARFDENDANGDGFLDAAELAASMRKAAQRASGGQGGPGGMGPGGPAGPR